MKNIFVGKANKQIGIRVTEAAKSEIERMSSKKNMSITDYLLSLVDMDLKNELEEDN